ncbi:cystathione beta-lyase [Palleronia marisminoris]|uniref:cysteine-S-conjugate beta-lyase n=1 Tax=Palleronia marisminoris TaxID=315423 RepID=A0A1Y5T144_9RHOB|nr:PatB family C-S lyase [Palleronia marisminoris]SFH12553.1 cystathione beta-lyase [Palleronia marisminoris]SLN53045.1 Cystathionine beta-lyase PatB [Palleronia marisminoris]
MSFDEIIDRRGTHCAKWDKMEAIYGVPAETGLAMWVADTEFRPPQCVQDAVARMHAHGVYGYYGDDTAYLEAIRWWMETRHGWSIDPAHILTTHGLVNATGLCVDAYTQPGDAVVLFTPVYHAFARVIRAAGREVRELQMPVVEGKYVLDIDAFDAAMQGNESMVIWCSPHNPGGRVWTAEENAAIADFAIRHNLALVSDEIHQDLTYPGHVHRPMALTPGVEDRLVTLNAPSKTFNIAGSHTGNVIIADDDLRARFAGRMGALGLSPNSFGLAMTEAAYSAEGAEWVDGLVAYLDENRRIFDATIAAIPGLSSMPLEATYLSWVDFSGTGMALSEATRRVEQDASIAANHGGTFGKGGESFLRFNIGMPRAQIEDACARLESAFADLQ